MLQQNFMYPGERVSQQMKLDNGATASSTHSKWGTYSLRCNGASNTSSAYLNYWWSNMFDVDGQGQGSGANNSAAYGTIEWWYYHETAADSNSYLFDTQEVSTEIQVLLLTNGKPYLRVYFDGAWRDTSASASALTLDTWYHMAICFNDDNIDWYLGGNRIASIYTGTGYLATSGGTTGRLGYGTYDGYFNDFRISKNVRYTGATYTVPTAALTNDENTYCLFSFDENTSSYFTDTPPY